MNWFLLILQDQVPAPKSLSMADFNLLSWGFGFFILAIVVLGVFLNALRGKGKKINPFRFLEEDNKKILEVVGITLVLECLIGAGIGFIAESSISEPGKVVFLLVVISVFIGLIIGVLFKIIVFIYEIKESFREYTSKTDSRITWEFHEKTIKNLKELAHASFRDDPTFVKLVNEEFQGFYANLYEYSIGHFKFDAESFRIYWRELIESDEASFYFSTALVNTPYYWRDGIGIEATNFTIKISEKKKVKKIFILNDKLWEDANTKTWIKDQKKRGENADLNKGVDVYVIKEKNIGKNEDIIFDFGIYGDRAVGYQELHEIADNEFRMTYNLYFSKEKIQLTNIRFKKLMEYASHDTQEYFEDGMAISPKEKVPQPSRGGVVAQLVAPVDQNPETNGKPKIEANPEPENQIGSPAETKPNGDSVLEIKTP